MPENAVKVGSLVRTRCKTGTQYRYCTVLEMKGDFIKVRWIGGKPWWTHVSRIEERKRKNDS